MDITCLVKEGIVRWELSNIIVCNFLLLIYHFRPRHDLRRVRCWKNVGKIPEDIPCEFRP